MEGVGRRPTPRQGKGLSRPENGEQSVQPEGQTFHGYGEQNALTGDK